MIISRRLDKIETVFFFAKYQKRAFLVCVLLEVIRISKKVGQQLYNKIFITI